METLLALSGITKSFGGVQALSGVSLDLIAGEVHALVGENGAGKSTLIKIITGAYERDAGTFLVEGRAIERHDPVQARKMGIAAIYQQPALLPELSVAENIAMRMEMAGPLHMIRWQQRRQRASQLLARVGARISPRMLVRDLSMSQQQLVEIAAALGCRATILILDEPTASLGDREVHNLFEVIGQLKRDGVGMIYISHRLEELPRIADRITVLRDGAYVGTRAMSEVDRPELIRMMVGRSLDAAFPKTQVPRGPVVLETQSLGHRQSGVTAVNLKVHAGEIVGLVGLVGAGRTELARILFGLAPADSGNILLRGKRIKVDSPWRATRLGIAYVPEDRRRYGVILDMSVAAIKRVDLRPCDDLQKKAFDEANTILTAHPDVTLIMAICSPAVPGAAEAVKQSGRKDVTVVGLGLPNDNNPYVHDGIVKGVVLWNTIDLGYLTIYAAKGSVDGSLKPGDSQFTAGRLGVKEVRQQNVLLGTPFTFDKSNIDGFDF